MNNKEVLPQIGEFYHFFDDGKVTPSRHYIAKCIEIIPFDKFSQLHIPKGRCLSKG